MKVRNGFVSNSSSSSFILRGEVDPVVWRIIEEKVKYINDLEETEYGVRIEETDDGIYITADYSAVEDIDWVLQRHNVEGEWSC